MTRENNLGVVNISEMSSHADMKSTSGSVSGNAVVKASARISDPSTLDDNLVHSKPEGASSNFDEEISGKVPSNISPAGLSSPSSVEVEIPPSKCSNGKPSDAERKVLEGPNEVASDVAYDDPPARDHNPMEKNNVTESANQHIDDTDDSDMVEEDVKVCDICGDAGREELLAVCCQCSDGAEHTYCMREMLDKVPEGDWMCEECSSLELVTYERPEKGRVDENERNNRSGQADSEHLNFVDSEEHRTEGHTKNSGKRLRDDADAEHSPIVKKPSLVSIAESSLTSKSSNTTAVSCENSMKNIERGRSKTSRYSSSEAAPINDTSVSAHNTSNLGLQQFRGTFSKSNSFNSLNSKPKVKPMDEVVLQKQMSTRDRGSFRLKEGVDRSIGKSTSFNSTSSSQSETKLKTLPPRLSQNQDTKNTKQWRSFERQSSFKMDHPSDNSVKEMSGSSTPDINKKRVSGDGSPSPTTINNHQEVKPVHTDVKSATLSRSCSIAAGRNADLSSPLGESKGQSHNHDGELRTLITSGANTTEQKSDLTSSNEDSTACSVVAERSRTNEGLTDGLSRSRDSANSDEVREHSGRHFRASSAKSSIDEDNIVKAAIAAALLRKPGVCRNRRTLSQSGNSCASHIRDTVANVAPAMPFLSKSLAIPQHEYIWKGSFEICRSGKVFDSWNGIQAHLSTCASSKVMEAVNNFKSRILLYEVPRVRTWPVQFQDRGVRDDNIALFFFAEDLESYDKIYKFFLDNMMKNDLALKANFNGVELLIFPSNQLPDNFQRWNMLFFLWGVFRGKKESCMQSMPESSEKCSSPQDRPISNDLPASEHAEGLGSLFSSRVANNGVSSGSAVQSESQCKEPSTTCVEVGIVSTPVRILSTDNSERGNVPMQVDASLDTQQSTHKDSNQSMEPMGEDTLKLKMDAKDLSTDEKSPFQKDRDPNHPMANEELSAEMLPVNNEPNGTRIGQKQANDGAVPNLNLALGAEMKSPTHEDNKPRSVGKKTDEELFFHEPKTKDDEREQESLSLSLSVRFQ